jgi:Tol biopolymer transport system component
MKKKLLVSLAFLMSLALAACGGQSNPPVNLTTTTAPTLPALQALPIPPRSGQGQIAFTSFDPSNQHKTYILNTDSGGPTNLTDDLADDLNPVWSPDGNKIVFVSDRNSFNGIYLMSANGSIASLNNNQSKGDNNDPVWSPDGTKIAFDSDRLTPPNSIAPASDIYVMNADGSNETHLTQGWSPIWSPSGKQIAFSKFSNIYVMASDGSGVTLLRKSYTQSDGNSQVAWSPDGNKIAFTYSEPNNGPWEIYIMNADGSNQTRLTNTKWDSSPAWSPDGKQLAFESKRDDNFQIYIMNADGSEQTRLTNDTNSNVSPAWSPNGKKIAFYSVFQNSVCLISADGGNATCINLGSIQIDLNFLFAWRP